jgi:REP element-mobilizing transposase RayT
MNRGLAHRPLFEGLRDARYFLSRLGQAVRRGEIEVHAWCLMTTHFHLLVRSPCGRLASALRRIQHEHTRRFNLRRGRDGPLYRSRYTSRPIDSLAYRCAVWHYIDANPVQAGITGAIGEHPLCSAAWFLRRRGPPWMERSWIEAEIRGCARASECRPEDYLPACGKPLTIDAY